MEAEQFKATLSRWPTGVTAVTWYDQQQEIQGITVSSFASLSLSPPLVLFCIARSAYVYTQLLSQSMLSVHILAEGQTALAYQFAGPDRSGLSDVMSAHPVYGVPILAHAHASLIGEVVDKLPQGDHDIFVLRLCDSLYSEETQPLLYHRSQIFTLPADVSR